METARKIIDLAFGFEGWVFGGYVRDNVVLNLGQVTDIDICFPYWVDIDVYIKTLGVFFKVIKLYDQTRLQGLYMSKCSKRLIKLEVNDIPIDIVILSNGNFSTWCDEHSTDLSCNLFYMTSTVPIGIRYVPDQFKHKPNPAKYLIQLAEKKLFIQLYGPSSDDYEESNMKKIRRRVAKMENKGWFITCTCC